MRGDFHECVGDPSLQLGVGEGQGVRFLKDELLQAPVGHQADTVTRDGPAAVGEPHRLGDGAQHTALERARALYLDLGALQRVEQRHRRGQCFGPEWQVAEELPERLAAGQADRADAALVVVDDDALEHVVDLVEPYLERQHGVALDHRLMLEIADAAGGQHNPPERQIARRAGPGRGRKGRENDEDTSETETHGSLLSSLKAIRPVRG